MRRSSVLALVAGALLVVPGTAAAAAARSQPVGVEAAKPYFDSRTGASSKAARAGTTVAAARPSTQTRLARTTLERRLGRQGVLNIDPLTGTPRQLLRTDGALSGPRGGTRADIAQDFVRANSTALGLDAADLDGLDLQRRATAPGGLTVVHFRQLYRGIPAFDNDLRVAIDRAGRVVSVAGSPRTTSRSTRSSQHQRAEAIARLQRNVGVERSLPCAPARRRPPRRRPSRAAASPAWCSSAPPAGPASPGTWPTARARPRSTTRSSTPRAARSSTGRT